VEWFDFLLMFHGHNLQVARVFTLSFDGIGSIFITLIRFRGFEYRDLIYYLSENVFTSVYEYNANPEIDISDSFSLLPGFVSRQS